MKSPRLLIALLALLALVGAACGGSEDTTTSSAAEATGSESESGGGEQLGIVLPTTDGGQLAFNDLEGKPALLWFWAPW